MTAPGFALLALVALAALVAGPSRALAQAMDTYGHGSRSASLAGAVTADVEDPSANYYNPAGIVRADELRIMLGYMVGVPDLEVDGRDASIDDVHGFVFGLNVPGKIGGIPIAFGLGGHLPDAWVSRSRTVPRRQPRWELYDNRQQRAFLAAHLAIEPIEWLRFGVGIGFQATSANVLDIEGTLGVLGSETETRLAQAVELALQTIRYPQVGVQVDPLEWLSFGLVYREGFGLDSTLFAEVRADIIAAGLDPFPGFVAIETASVNTFNPRQASLGASVRPVEGLTVGLEVSWVNWAQYESPIGFSDVVLTLDVPPELAGAITVPESIMPGVPIPAEFSDRFVPRIGVEYVATLSEDVALSGRLGYAFEASPAPQQTGFTNLVDSDRHVLDVGAGIRLGSLEPLIDGFVDVSAHFQVAVLPDRAHVKSSPIDPIGDYVAGGVMWSGGGTLEVGFE
jgi:long-chain fatty acid transport protein